MQNAGGDFRHAGIARGIAQLRLQVLLALLLQHLVGDVPGNAEDAHRLAALVAEDARVRFEMNGVARRRDDAKAKRADVLAFRHRLA